MRNDRDAQSVMQYGIFATQEIDLVGVVEVHLVDSFLACAVSEWANGRRRVKIVGPFPIRVL